MKSLLIAALAIFLAAIAPPSSAEIKYIAQEQYSGQWPFTVPNGRIACLLEPGWRGDPAPGYGSVIFFAGNQTYMLNGTAIAANQKSNYHWKPVDEIWRVDEKLKKELGSGANFVPRINLGPMIDIGLKLCK